MYRQVQLASLPLDGSVLEQCLVAISSHPVLGPFLAATSYSDVRGEAAPIYMSGKKRHSQSWGMGAEHPTPMKMQPLDIGPEQGRRSVEQTCTQEELAVVFCLLGARTDCKRPFRPGWRSLCGAASLAGSQKRCTQQGGGFRKNSPVSTYDPG